MRKSLILFSAAMLSLLAARPAFAHVTVSPSTVPKGSFSKLTFNVPNEDESAATTQVEIFFPDDAPLAFASVKPIPGWTYAVERRHLAKPITSDDGQVSEVVSKITWSGGRIGPGEFQEFTVSAGPLPSTVSSMTFKALQTYDNGNVVRWIETQTGSEEPEHPAPVLELSAVLADNGSSDEAVDQDQADTLARVLAGAGLVAGLAGVGLALSRRRAA